VAETKSLKGGLINVNLDPRIEFDTYLSNLSIYWRNCSCNRQSTSIELREECTCASAYRFPSGIRYHSIDCDSKILWNWC
jgi:hypothetical protein